MRQFSVHGNRYFGYGAIITGVAITMAILAFTLWFHQPRAHAQQPKPLVPVAAPHAAHTPLDGNAAAPKVPATPPSDPALVRVGMIDALIEQKQQFIDATESSIAERRQVIAQCQRNIDEATNSVEGDGLDDLDQRIRLTRPQIQNLKQVIDDNRAKIAMLSHLIDLLDRRILQLMLQKVNELQPDSSHLRALKRQLETGVSAILSEIDPDDPYSSLELARVASLRAQMEPRIETAEALVLQRAADQAVAAGELEDREYDRSLRQETDDSSAQ